MNIVSQIAADLKAQLEIFNELLMLSARDAEALRHDSVEGLQDKASQKEKLLPRLDEAMKTLKRNSEIWQTLPVGERQRHPEIQALLKKGQDAVMKILMLDRQNEQGLLKKGLVPSNMLPSANRQRPAYVASLYSRNQ